MGFMSSFGTLWSPRVKKYQRSLTKLEKLRATQMVANADRALEFREKEDPREQAYLKQSMFGRGLGKSSISDQGKDRLDMIQSQRMGRLKEAQTYAYAYKKMIRRKHDYDKVNKYMQIIDSFLAVAAGGSQGAGTGQENNYGMPSEGSSFGGAGDYNFGGYS